MLRRLLTHWVFNKTEDYHIEEGIRKKERKKEREEPIMYSVYHVICLESYRSTLFVALGLWRERRSA